MTYEITEDQFTALEKISQMQDSLNFLMTQNIGYMSVKELVNAYKSDNITIISDKKELK